MYTAWIQPSPYIIFGSRFSRNRRASVKHDVREVSIIVMMGKGEETRPFFVPRLRRERGPIR